MRYTKQSLSQESEGSRRPSGERASAMASKERLVYNLYGSSGKQQDALSEIFHLSHALRLRTCACTTLILIVLFLFCRRAAGKSRLARYLHKGRRRR